jgi:hypothetical protein
MRNLIKIDGGYGDGEIENQETRTAGYQGIRDTI